jgi:hypothetical protein
MSVPDPSTTDWVPVWNIDDATTSPPIPKPVVNGQWIKGVGGAPVWSAIAQSDLGSSPIGANPPQLPNNDFNQVAASGWYYASNTNANGPVADWLYVRALVLDANSQDQEAWTINVNAIPARRWRRQKVGGTWTPWKLRDDAVWHVVGAAGEPAFQNGFVNYGTFTPARFRMSGGIVIVQAMVRNGTAGTVIWNMPVGYRPGAQILAAIVSGEPPTGSRCDITVSGDLTCDSRNPQGWQAINLAYTPDA